MTPVRASSFLLGLILACTDDDGEAVTYGFLLRSYIARAITKGNSPENAKHYLKRDVKFLEDEGLVHRAGSFVMVNDYEALEAMLVRIQEAMAS